MDTVETISKYNLSDEQEKKLILREYRALLRSLKPKLKAGDKELLRTAFEMVELPVDLLDKAEYSAL